MHEDTIKLVGTTLSSILVVSQLIEAGINKAPAPVFKLEPQTQAGEQSKTEYVVDFTHNLCETAKLCDISILNFPQLAALLQ